MESANTYLNVEHCLCDWMLRYGRHDLQILLHRANLNTFETHKKTLSPNKYLREFFLEVGRLLQTGEPLVLPPLPSPFFAATAATQEALPLNPSIRELIQTTMDTLGYDGLFFESECGCHTDDLYPCGSVGLECQLGHRCGDVVTSDGNPISETEEGE